MEANRELIEEKDSALGVIAYIWFKAYLDPSPRKDMISAFLTLLVLFQQGY